MSEWRAEDCCKQPDDCKWGGTGPCDPRVYPWLRGHGWTQDPPLPSGMIGTRLWREPKPPGGRGMTAREVQVLEDRCAALESQLAALKAAVEDAGCLVGETKSGEPYVDNWSAAQAERSLARTAEALQKLRDRLGVDFEA